MGTKKNHQKTAKKVCLFKKPIRKYKKAGFINKQCLGGYFDLSFKT